MAGKHNLVCDQGSTFTFAFTIKNGDTLWNLAGYTATMTVRPFATSTTTSVLATNNNGKIALGGALGTVTVTLSASETAQLTGGKYVYDFVLTSGGGIVTRLLEGKFVVTESVS